MAPRGAMNSCMVRDDIEACLQAYQFAELALGGFASRPEKEKRQALAAATQLRDEVEARYALVVADEHDAVAARVAAVKAARAQLELHLADAERLTPVE
jgi:hypothetical protein